jgi:signal transduction histidine kinase
LTDLSARASAAVDLKVDGVDDLDLDHLAFAYFFCAEGLTNAARHALAAAVVVRVERQAGLLRLEVRDFGIGGAVLRRGGGLQGLSDRAATSSSAAPRAARHGSGRPCR